MKKLKYIILALLFFISFSSAQLTGSPIAFLGFKKYESPEISKVNLKDLKIVSGGHMKNPNFVYLSVRGYIDPSGTYIELLTLFYTDEEKPKLIAIGAGGQAIDKSAAIRILALYMVNFNADKGVEKDTGLPFVNKTFEDGSKFNISLIPSGTEFIILKLLSWPLPEMENK